MSTIAEIEAAIRALPPADRERLADDLPSILPELNGDAKWQRIISDAGGTLSTVDVSLIVTATNGRMLPISYPPFGKYQPSAKTIRICRSKI